MLPLSTPAMVAEAAPTAVAASPLVAEQCLNCEQPLATGPFCPSCGQQRPHRLSTAHVLHELVHVFTHADKSIFGYAGQVLLHPGRVVADYLRGRRKHYFNPFQFLLIMVGLVTTAGLLLHFYEGTGAGVVQSMAKHGVSAERLARVSKYFAYISKYHNVWWLLLLLPLYSLVTWGMYRRRLNFAEAFFVHVVIGSAFHVLLLLAMLPILWLTKGQPGNQASLFQSVVVCGYLVAIGRQALGLSWGGAFWRAVAVVVLGIALSWQLNGLVFRWYVFG
ncbi:DUF3667 domain-containing protein [Solirubrum puertoriconensis]|uniref:DUF3667 domain-containing protein n=1 Tax=Solirubrum puertoriconensis TaxID=1751427 RepID=A0A9X0HPE2_SOLP1|nr:DUF3667 domain-containing protein [Solirubrum puertoriconensis]KUG09661.1 hypothetical protein ASU33_18400 [Solirubrum puertoriconensis]